MAVAWWWSLSRRHGDRLPLTANQDRGGLTAELAQYRWCLASGSWLLRLQDNTLGYLSGTNKRKEQGMKGKKKDPVTNSSTAQLLILENHHGMCAAMLLSICKVTFIQPLDNCNTHPAGNMRKRF